MHSERWKVVAITVLAVSVIGGIAVAGQRWSQETASTAVPARDSRTPSPTPTEAHHPSVDKRVEATFADVIPDGFRVFDTGFNESGMEVQDDLLVHGAPTQTNAASYLERELPADVERIGAEVEFAEENAGAIALVAWETSLVDARNANLTVPYSGLHFVAYPGQWHLGMIDPETEQLEDIIVKGRYPVDGTTATFDIYRDGDTAWIVDPAGEMTEVSDPRIAKWAGPFACWELYEPVAGMNPAAFREVWAG